MLLALWIYDSLNFECIIACAAYTVQTHMGAPAPVDGANTSRLVVPIARYMTKTTNNQYHLPCVCRVLVGFCCIYKRKRGKINTKPECNAILFCAIGVTRQPYILAVWAPRGLLLCQRMVMVSVETFIHTNSFSPIK